MAGDGGEVDGRPVSELVREWLPSRSLSLTLDLLSALCLRPRVLGDNTLEPLGGEDGGDCGGGEVDGGEVVGCGERAPLRDGGLVLSFDTSSSSSIVVSEQVWWCWWRWWELDLDGG